MWNPAPSLCTSWISGFSVRKALMEKKACFYKAKSNMVLNTKLACVTVGSLGDRVQGNVLAAWNYVEGVVLEL